MPCETCGAAVTITKSEGGTQTGRFIEEYECSNGHIGKVTGENESDPRGWDKWGAVFQ